MSQFFDAVAPAQSSIVYSSSSLQTHEGNLTRSQVMLMLLAQGPHSEKHYLGQFSEGSSCKLSAATLREVGGWDSGQEGQGGLDRAATMW